MGNNIYSVITGTGSYIPAQKIDNEYFLEHDFFDARRERINKENIDIITKFKAITTIEERRYVKDELVTSDIAYLSAADALEKSSINKETLDYIIVAHNFGDVKSDNRRSDFVPSLASRVKQRLGIENPYCVAYDVAFGCPGWLQCLIQADYYIKSGDAKRIMVIGAETLSRVVDPHDRDSMLYADGAGTVIVEAKESDTPIGVLAHATRTDAKDYALMLQMAESYNDGDENKGNLYLKMQGRKLYQYALSHVPGAIKACLEKSNTCLSQINKVLIHQANGKMDDAILERLYNLYDGVEIPSDVMPMTVDWLGNSSVATVPTLLDLIVSGKMEEHTIEKNDLIVFASVGAGMNINAMVYKAV
ncbi:MAG: ketoacyl-ACP synthase III [Bacteroidota bacterium]